MAACITAVDSVWRNAESLTTQGKEGVLLQKFYVNTKKNNKPGHRCLEPGTQTEQYF